MTCSAGLAAWHMIGLGIGMAKAACIPVQGHVGDIREGIQMVSWHALPHMAHGAVHVSGGRMSSHTAAIIGIDWECALDMAALAFRFGTVVQFQAGMGAGPGVADRTWLRTVYMYPLGIGMAKAAGHPVQGHIGDICEGIQMVQRIALPDMAHGAVHVCGWRMCAHTAAIIGVDRECALDMTALALELGTVIQLQAGMVACP